MTAPAPELPRRTPGAALTGDEFEQLAPLVTGQLPCFECERHPAKFRTTTTVMTADGAVIGQTFNLCQHCAGPTAADLPADVDVVLTRIHTEEI